MAEELLRSKHGFGSSANIQDAIDAKKLDEYDILFLDGDTDNPKIGWIDKNGKVIIVNADSDNLKAIVKALQDEMTKKISAEEVDSKIAGKADAEDVAALENELATKANAEEVDKKLDKVATESKAYTDGKIESAVNEHLAKLYEFTDVPVGTLVDYREDEIRIMCPANAEFTKQSVGAGGDASCYYGTLKTYVPNDAVVGYIEHLGDKVDVEILTDLKTDEYGRRYQPTWLALARYDDATGNWTYYGANSSKEKYIGWDYQIDWFNADGVMIASDSIRINLSNESCHHEIKPYYMAITSTEVETKIDEASQEAVSTSKAYIDEQIAALNNSFAIVEF